ncbi:hypothetical protein ACQ5ES_08825 [Pseudidiomarina sp. E22-M8]|uniref:hypothetical protein n=1 Tax=Pseudidiomarina sp. E22-M8 TaxID=3424768 RepID=UPI00403C354E
MENPTFGVKLELLDNYKFEMDFGDFGRIITDEPEPLGASESFVITFKFLQVTLRKNTVA